MVTASDHGTARRPGGGGLTVIAPHHLAITSVEFDIAPYRYYGPRHRTEISGPAVVLDKQFLCDKKYATRNKSYIQGKIVIIGVHSCDGIALGLDTIYGNYEKFGVKAVLIVALSQIYPPEAQSFNFESWDHCRFCKQPTPMYLVDAVVASTLPLWRQVPGLSLRIASLGKIS